MKPVFKEIFVLFNEKESEFEKDQFNREFITLNLTTIESYNPSTRKNTTTVRTISGAAYLVDMNYFDFKKLMVENKLETEETITIP